MLGELGDFKIVVLCVSGIFKRVIERDQHNKGVFQGQVKGYGFRIRIRHGFWSISERT